MNLNKTAVATALTAALGLASTSASADSITMSFDGVFSLGSAAGVIQVNSDSTLDAGYRTAVSGTGSFDTVSGSGTAQINAFSFFGGGLASATNTSFQAIGDGFVVLVRWLQVRWASTGMATQVSQSLRFLMQQVSLVLSAPSVQPGL